MLDIVIPCANEPKYLARMLESIGKQIKDKSLIQIYIVDDCTEYEDEYKLELGKFGNKYEMTDGKSIFYIRNEERLGPGGSRNKGIEAGEDEFICFWDDDDIITDNLFNYLTLDSDLVHSHVVFEGMPEKYQPPKNSFFDPCFGLIIKRSFLIENNIKFPEYKYGKEDVIFTNIIYIMANSYNFSATPYYYHFGRKDSKYSPKQFSETIGKDKNTLYLYNNLCFISLLFKELMKYKDKKFNYYYLFHTINCLKDRGKNSSNNRYYEDYYYILIYFAILLIDKNKLQEWISQDRIKDKGFIKFLTFCYHNCLVKGNLLIINNEIIVNIKDLCNTYINFYQTLFKKCFFLDF